MDVWVAALCLIKPTVCESHCIFFPPSPRAHVHQLHFSITHNALRATVAAKGASSLKGLLVWRQKLDATFMIYIYKSICGMFLLFLKYLFIFSRYFMYTRIYLGRWEACIKDTEAQPQYLSGTVGKKISKVPQRDTTKTVERGKIFVVAWLLFFRRCGMMPQEAQKKTQNTPPSFFMLFDSCHLLLCAS